MLLTVTVILPILSVHAQDKLEKKISIAIQQKPLSRALTEIGRQGGFFFSYNTTIIPGDSLVDIKARDKTVRQILEDLLGSGYEYTETGKYIIILQRAGPSPPVRYFSVTGYIKDESTREKISNASIYESNQLVSALTDTNGYFRLKLKDKYAFVTLVISKQLYRDTLLVIRPGVDQQLTIGISKEKITDLQTVFITNHVEKTWLGRAFLSYKEIIQSMNLGGFFANKPVQFSLVPGLGTHGRMGAQVVNKMSVNAIGGFTAGLNGMELAGIFNIDKQEVQYMQAAGIFNMVGGFVKGVQLAGIYNHDLDSVQGCQAAGIANYVKGSVKGMQLAGILNVVEKDVRGFQAAGIYNRVHGNVRGLQMSGIASINDGETRGLQASSIVNRTKHLKGLQIGLINIADTSSGFMLGLVNIVKRGYHEFTLSANEMMPLNFSYKAGRRKIYSLLSAGFDPRSNEKAYAWGFGVGNLSSLGHHLDLATEFTQFNFYLGKWKKSPTVYRLQSTMTLHVSKRFSLFAGPAFSLYNPENIKSSDGYKTILPSSHYGTFSIGSMSAWIGWSTGINFF